MLARIQAIDDAALGIVRRWRPVPLTWALRWFTYSGTAYAWFLLAGALYACERTVGLPFPAPALFLRCLFAPLAAWLSSSVVKRLTVRPRPANAIPGFPVLTRVPTDSSFPSGHAAAAWAFCAALARVHHPLAPLVGLWAALVSFSRFYLGVHYLSDVLAGTLWGLGWGLLLAPGA
jgi:undecaprenyl-diphosphatase